MDKKSWTIDDLIDLEYFLSHDDSVLDDDKRAALHSRDRSIFLDFVKADAREEIHKQQPIVHLIKQWVEARRKQETANVFETPILPGQLYGHAYKFMLLALAAAGLLSGSGLCITFLVYKGHEPINVAAYLGVFVATQILLVCMFLVLFVIARNHSSENRFSLIRYSLAHLLIKFSLWIKKKADSHLSAETRSRIESAMGIIKGHSRNYGFLFPFPVFILVQVFAVFFNIGVLGATLLRVIGSDLAFGWQSTLQLSSGVVYKLVSILSWPWSSFIPSSIAHPDIAQIEGTRIILKDGIYFLSTPNLVSWWPFLCFCVLFYGLIPRLVLLSGALFLRNKALGRMTFNSIACDRLIYRMTHPVVNTLSPDTEDRLPYVSGKLEIPERPASMHRNVPSLVLVPEDICGTIDKEGLQKHVGLLFGIDLMNVMTITLDMMVDHKQLAETVPYFGGNRLVFIMEAWQAPIRETLYYIKETKALGQSGLRIYILLTGKPSNGNTLTKPDELDIVIWQKKINTLADPDIRVDWIRSHHEQEDKHGAS